MNVKKGYEKAHSLNGKMPISSKTKLIIVGTITSPNGKELFYTTRNDIYIYMAILMKHLIKRILKTKQQN